LLGQVVLLRKRTVGAFVLAACSIAALFAMPVRADDAAALLATHRAYVGWQSGDGAITSLRESGTVTRDGKVLARISALNRGFAYRRIDASPNGTFEDGFTGHVLWISNLNGFTVRSIGEPAQYAASYAALFDEALDAMPATVLRQEMLDGVAVTWIHLTPPVGVTLDLAVDATGAFKRVVLDPSGKYETTFDILGYTDVGNGKRVISSWRYAGQHAVNAYTEIEANVAVSDEDLHPPKQRATWTFDPAMATVPVELTEERILIDATINGVKGRFIFDTGSAGIALTDSFARRVKAERLGQSEIEGIGGGATANLYTLGTVAFGNNVLHDVVAFTGLDENDEMFKDTAGLIGFDLLAGAIVDLDLDKGTMRILDPQRFEPDKSLGFVVPIDLTDGTPRVPMKVGGQVPVLATLDSGNPAWVLFSKSLQTRDRVRFFVDPTALVQQLQIYGVNGTEIDRCGKLQSLELGKITYAPVPACASDSMPRSEVLVGLEFIRAFNIVFDYPDGYLVMRKR
jgi:predicted aspartyl protease